MDCKFRSCAVIQSKRLLTAVVVLVLLTLIGSRAQTQNRYEAFLFGVCYYPEQWPESEWEADARSMKECGVNVVRMGEFGWAMMEPREGRYDFSLFDRAIETFGRQGIKTNFRDTHRRAPKMAHTQVS